MLRFGRRAGGQRQVRRRQRRAAADLGRVAPEAVVGRQRGARTGAVVVACRRRSPWGATLLIRTCGWAAPRHAYDDQMTADVDTTWLPPIGDDWLACSSAVAACGSGLHLGGARPTPGPPSRSPGRPATTPATAPASTCSSTRPTTSRSCRCWRVVAARPASGTRTSARIALWHRTGALQVTDAAVVVAVSSPHRDAAFDAARWAIDEVKATAPIWKREHWAGGHDDWGRCDHRHDHDVTGLHRPAVGAS